MDSLAGPGQEMQEYCPALSRKTLSAEVFLPLKKAEDRLILKES